MKERRTFKEKLVDKLVKRIELLKKRLSKYNSLVLEIKECEETLKSLLPKPIPAIHDPSDLYKDTNDQSAYSARMINILVDMPLEFGPDDLSMKLSNDKSLAYQQIAMWKRKNYIETVQRGVYRKTKNTPTEHINGN